MPVSPSCFLNLILSLNLFQNSAVSFYYSSEILSPIVSSWLTPEPLSPCSRVPDPTPPILTADGSPMVCSGTKINPLPFSCGKDSKVYTWTFQLAPVSVPLLGADFLEHFNLLVDIKGRKVVHAQCPESVILHASPTPQPAFPRTSFLSAPPQIEKLLSKFPHFLSSDGFSFNPSLSFAA